MCDFDFYGDPFRECCFIIIPDGATYSILTKTHFSQAPFHIKIIGGEEYKNKVSLSEVKHMSIMWRDSLINPPGMIDRFLD